MNSTRPDMLMCAAQALSLLRLSAYPALLQAFITTLSLSNIIEPRWIAGIYYAGYMLPMPVLASAANHIYGPRIYLNDRPYQLVRR